MLGRHLIIIAYVLIWVASCEQNSKPKAPPPQGATNGFEQYQPGTPGGMSQIGMTNLPCVQGNCPKAQIEITSGLSGSVLQSYVNQPVNWSFQARAYNASREIRIIDLVPQGTLPQGMQINKGLGTPTVIWTPNYQSPRTGTLVVKARDMTRCQQLAMGTNNCSNFAIATEHDEQRNFSWMIDGANGQQGNQPNLILAALPAILQILQGGDIGSALGSVIGNITGGGNIGGGMLGQNTINLHHSSDN